MTMGEDGSIRVPLHIDVSAVADDLAQIDREVGRLQQRMVSAFNRSSLVRRGRVPRAQGIEDVGEQRSAWTPELRQLDRQLGARLQAIERAARAGATRPPLTAQQEARQAALGRLAQIERQARPVEITARGEFFDRFRQSLLRGMPNMATMAAAQGNVPGAAGMARLLMGLAADNPLAAGALAVGAGALGINALQAGFQRQQAALASALVGGPQFGSTRTLLGLGVMSAGGGIDTWPKEAQSVALGLAGAGVGGPNLLKNLSNTLMLAKPNAIPSEQVTPLVAALGTAGGLNANQINRVLQDTVNGARDAGVSLQQLLGGMTALSHGAVGAAKDVLSLAAVQHVVGASSGINAGALLQGVMGASGAQALQSAALLGMSPQAFMGAQASRGGMAQIWDRIAAFTRHLPAGAQGTLVAEQLLDQTGLLNMQGLSATQKAGLVQTLRMQGPRAAEQLAAQYTAQTTQQAVSFQQSMKNAAAATDNLTPALERLMIGVDVATQHLINPAPPHLTQQQTIRRLSTGTSAGYNAGALSGALTMGLRVPNLRGAPNYASPEVVRAYLAASRATGVPVDILLAQGSQESSFNIHAPGGGLGQFTPATIHGLATGRDVAASTRSFFAHFNPATASLGQQAQAQALYDQYLIARYGTVGGLNAYNTGSPRAGYGAGIVHQAHTLNITVTVKDERGQTLAHQVNHHRVVPGHVHHGPPAPVPPGPGRRR